VKIYEGPLGLVDVHGAELYAGDLVVFSRPLRTTSRLSLAYIDKYNTDSGFITVILKDFKPDYSWESKFISMKFSPDKFYWVDRPNA